MYRKVVQNVPSAAEEQPWFYRIEDTADPWRHWFRMLRFPRHGPLDAEIERHIEELCQAADERRLAIVPTTKRFAEMWATFRRHHEGLEDCWKYRRRRWLVWRAAALKVAFECGWGQDEADDVVIRGKLAETMAEFGPVAADGSYNGGNFWRPSVSHDGEPLAEYAMMVLVLVRATA
jgi:hypothetical protein